MLVYFAGTLKRSTLKLLVSDTESLRSHSKPAEATTQNTSVEIFYFVC